jgi:RimJ/RimL family protein N-acetyltransferase
MSRVRSDRERGTSAHVLIHTARLELRRFTPGDLRSLLAYRRDPDVARYQSWSANYPESEARAFIATVGSATLGARAWVNVAVELKANRELIGDVALRVDQDRTSGEIGFTFAPAFQGCGYAREAVSALCAFASVELRLRRLYANTDARNARAIRLLEMTEFRDTGTHRRVSYKGEMCDELCFELVFRE